MGNEAVSQALCRQLRQSLPKVYKDQLYAVRSLLRQYAPVELEMLSGLNKPGLTASRIEAQLATSANAMPSPCLKALVQLDWSAYQQLGQRTGQGCHMGMLVGELNHLLAEAGRMPYLSFANRLAEYEFAQRQSTYVHLNFKGAGLPAQKHLEGFDDRHQPTISKHQVSALLDFQFIDEMLRNPSNHTT